MKIPVLFVTLGLFIALLFSATAAATGGRIGFAGAIVEPTCSVPTTDVTLGITAQPVTKALRLSCAGPASAMIPAHRMYSLTVKQLASSEPDRVLAYFYTYVKASRPDAADPILLTQTYD